MAGEDGGTRLARLAAAGGAAVDNNDAAGPSVDSSTFRSAAAPAAGGSTGAGASVLVPTLRLPQHSAASLRAAGVAVAPAARAFIANAAGSLLPPAVRALLLGRAAAASAGAADTAGAAGAAGAAEEEAIESAAALAARGILLQESSLRVAMNVTLAALVAYVAVAVPLAVGFSLPDSQPLATFNRIVDAFFFLDMAVTARTAERASVAPLRRLGRHAGGGAGGGERGGERGERHAALAHDVLQTDPGALLVAYLRGSFLLDLVSSLPWDAIVLGALGDAQTPDAGTGDDLQQIPLLLRLLRLVRLVRLLRLLRLGKLGSFYEALLVRHPVALVLASASAQVFLAVHVLACFCVYCIVNSNDARPWWDAYIFFGAAGSMNLNPALQADQPLGVKYLAAVYWSVSTVTTTGVGDIFPANDPQRAYNAGAIVAGVVFYAYIVGVLTSAMTATTRRAAADSVASVDRAARDARLPAMLRDRLVAYRQRRLLHFTPLDEAKLLAELPYTLRKEVALALNCRSPVPVALAGGGGGSSGGGGGGNGWRALLEAVGSAAAPLHIDTQLLFECSSAAEPRWIGAGEAACWRGDAVAEVLVVADGELRPLSAAEEAEDDEDASDSEREGGDGSPSAAAESVRVGGGGGGGGGSGGASCARGSSSSAAWLEAAEAPP